MKKIPKPKLKGFKKPFLTFLILMITSFAGFTQGATITGPESAPGIPAILSGGVTVGQVYSTQPGMKGYFWTVSAQGAITAGQGTRQITVTWTDPISQQSVGVTYTTDRKAPVAKSATLIINYYPFLPAIDPTIIPQFVDPLPHFAAELRVNAKEGGDITVTAKPIQQIALSTGTVLQNGTIGNPSTPNAGKGNYAGYEITSNGIVYPAMWPARTIEARQGSPLKVQYKNELTGVKYSAFNILADQTLMMKGYSLTGNPLTDPYDGPIPMVVHLHGGEIPSDSDGGPNAWFMPEGTTGVNTVGPAFQYHASTLSTYPNEQEAATLWYHPHDDGLTRINVYTGLAGYYFLRGEDEEAAKLPGWSGDGKVGEVTPQGKTATFNGANTYLPEIELGIQDRMFNVNGELFWPVAPPNPELHPFWTPEFVGDVMVVNGKSWPYLSVAPRKYRFRILDGCNARFLNMWLAGANGAPGPAITVVGGEGGLLANPVKLDPILAQTLLMAPGQRYDVVIDFTGLPAGATYTLMNNANSPYPVGFPVVPGLTDRIMQFVVNGTLVETDKSQLPANLRPVNPLVKLTDFAGNLTTGVTPAVKRQIILNEVIAGGGPAAVLINNAFFDAELAIPGAPFKFGGPTEIPEEGSTEIFQIINVSADAHPIHIHLTQWQIVSRQKIDDVGYLTDYTAAWNANSQNLGEYPIGQGYPGGAGSPFDYNVPNGDGYLGGNPAIRPALLGAVIPANPEEQGWKDNVIVMPGEVTTFITRIAPTDRPVDASPEQLMFPFDPSAGPGYVWHCHIIDHEDMSMMRPLPIDPSPLRSAPTFTVKPGAFACMNSDVTYTTQYEMTDYTWTFPGELNVDYQLISGGTTSTHTSTIRYLTEGPKKVSVNYTNSNERTSSVPAMSTTTIETKPVQPGVITASAATIIQGMTYTYSVPPVAGLTYNWTYLGTGATIVETSNFATVTFSSTATSGDLSVTASNACGTSIAQTINVTILGPIATPIALTPISTTVCNTQSKTRAIYTVQKVIGLTYTWSYVSPSGLPDPGVTIKESTTNSVSLTFSNAEVGTGTLSVTATNAAGQKSIPLNFQITVNACTLKSASIEGPEPGPIVKNELKVYPNPTSGAVNFEFQITENARVTLDIITMIGTPIDRVFDADVEAGETHIELFDKAIPTGVYFYQMKWNDQIITGKFIKTN